MPGEIALAQLSSAVQAGLSAPPTQQRRVGVGQTYATIASAVAAATAGDEILIYPGTYTELVQPTKHLCFRALIPGSVIWLAVVNTVRTASWAAVGTTTFAGIQFGKSAVGLSAFLAKGAAASLGSYLRFQDCRFEAFDGTDEVLTVDRDGQEIGVSLDQCVIESTGVVGKVLVQSTSSSFPTILRDCIGSAYFTVGLSATAKIANLRLHNCAFEAPSSVLTDTAAAHNVFARGCTGITYGAAGFEFEAGSVIDTERVVISPVIVGGAGEISTAHTLYCVPRNVIGYLTAVDANPAAEVALVEGVHSNSVIKFTCTQTIGSFRFRAEA